MTKELAVKNTYYALRHGHSEKNELDLVVSYPEQKPYHLTEKGRKQVQEGAAWLKREHIDAVYSSDLTRTRESAEMVVEILDNGVTIAFDKRLREIDFGVFNNKTHPQWHAFFNNYKNNFKERFTKRPEGGEHYGDVVKRMVSFFIEKEEQCTDQHILLVSHGDPLWLLQWATWCVSVDKLRDVPYPETGKAVKLDVRCIPTLQF